jgi:hypothetical protein
MQLANDAATSALLTVVDAEAGHHIMLQTESKQQHCRQQY